MTLPPLPIDAVLPEVLDALRSGPNVVVRAPAGAGKTTRIPPALLDAGLGGRGRVLVLEPRRLAVRAAARRMATERGSRLGDEVGYQIRFERCCGPATKLLVVTPGILLRFLHHDPFLESSAVVVFDEFHERGLDSDLALGMARLVQQTVRPELRLVAMSATMESSEVTAYLGDCPAVVGEGPIYPVELVYEPRPEHRPWPVAVAGAIENLLDRTGGDVLVFLPGLGEIRQSARQLEPLARERRLAVMALHGDLPAEQQDAALLPQPLRKIVLATNVAETSVTVEGVTGVVDTGLARTLTFDPGLGLDRLRLTPISRASADQRAGRAGRTRPGICVRLWGEGAHRSRRAHEEPEVRRVDLAGAMLQLLTLGEANVTHFPWLDAPPTTAVEQALVLLRRLGAADDHGPTELGKTLARLPVHPRLGRLLVEGRRLGQPDRVALAAALLSERDPFSRGTEASSGPARRRTATHSDVLDRVEMLEAFERGDRAPTPLGPLNHGAARGILRARDQLQRILSREKQHAPGGIEAPDPGEAVQRALFAAFPDRLARRRAPGSPRGLMVGGRGVRLAPTSGVTEAELFVGVDVDAGQAEAIVRQASAVRRDWLPAAKLRPSVEVSFDEKTEQATARKRVRWEDLLLDDVPAALPPGETVAAVLANAASTRVDRVLPPPDSPAAAYRTRVHCLREWVPELGLPALDEDQLRDCLPQLCQGCRSFADLRAADWLHAIREKLTNAQREAVEREAPERLEVPSGSRVALHYAEGRPPVLAVRIQEVFGLTETPRVGRHRVGVLLHLLAPNYRPQQVTDDLASFWANTYPLVRKELRARYPRHAWPEDPYTALPESRPKRRGPGR